MKNGKRIREAAKELARVTGGNAKNIETIIRADASATRKRILEVQIRYKDDPSPDASYLEQEDFAERLQQWKDGQFAYIGIIAQANISITGDLLQSVHSGGLWGIESDSDAAYLKEIESEQLAELKTELTALGFSKRAIAKAFQNIERKDS